MRVNDNYLLTWSEDFVFVVSIVEDGKMTGKGMGLRDTIFSFILPCNDSSPSGFL